MKCPDCGKALEYNSITDLWMCSCGYAESAYEPEPVAVWLPCCSCGVVYVNTTEGKDTCQQCLDNV